MTEPKKPASRKSWLGDSAPWEEYCGVKVPVMEGGETVRVLELGGGKLRVSEPSAAVGESERTDFEFGGGVGSRTSYSIPSLGSEVLLTEDEKVRAMEMAYKFDREDPFFHAVIQGYLVFIIGKGIKFQARDEDHKVQEYLDLFWKENKMDGKDADWVRRYLKCGELALRWFEEDAQGRAAAVPKVRAVPFWRIVSVEVDKQDAEKAVSYGVSDASDPAKLMGEPVPAAEIMMWRNGDSEEVRGTPPFLPIMRACKWYADWLLNRVVLNRYRTAHVLFKKVKGSPSKSTSVSTSSPDASSHKGSGGKVEKRLPKPGTMVIHNENIEYEWKSPELGAADAHNDGRAITTYICAGGTVPEFLLGDASNSNLASTLVSENPFVRQVEFYQDLFSGIFSEVFSRVIRHGIKVGKLPAMSRETVAEGSGMLAMARRALRLLHVGEGVLGQETRPVPTKTEVDITWPSMIHADQLKEATTLQIHQAMGAASLHTIREKLGYDNDVETVRLAQENEEGADKYARARDEEVEPTEKPEDESEQ